YLAAYTSGGTPRFRVDLGSHLDGGAGGYGNGVAADADGNAFFTGVSYGRLDFDPDSDVTVELPGGPFLASYTPAGALRFAHSDGAGFGDAVAVDRDGNVHVTHSDTYGSYTGAGAPRFAHVVGDGGSADVAALVSSGPGDVYVGGTFSGTVDFDPDPDQTAFHTSAGGTDVFVVSYTRRGCPLSLV